MNETITPLIEQVARDAMALAASQRARIAELEQQLRDLREQLSAGGAA